MWIAFFKEYLEGSAVLLFEVIFYEMVIYIPWELSSENHNIMGLREEYTGL